MDTKTRPKRAQAQPGEELLQAIRAGFILQGTNFTQYCLTNGIGPANARMAIRGGWKGPKATALIKQLIAASGARAAA